MGLEQVEDGLGLLGIFGGCVFADLCEGVVGFGLYLGLGGD
jgi:hypothetical protein